MHLLREFEVIGMRQAIGLSKGNISEDEAILIIRCFKALKRMPLTRETFMGKDDEGDPCLVTPTLPDKKFFMSYKIDNNVVRVLRVGLMFNL